VGRDGVDVRADDVGLDLVARALDRVLARRIGFSHAEKTSAAVAVAERGERHHGPERAMRVLAAVLADARRIAADVAGVDGAVDRRAA
jgi:hypothetical protein